MGQTLEKPELTEEQIEEYNIRKQIYNSKFSEFIKYDYENKIYIVDYYLTKYFIKRLGYYKTFEEAENKIKCTIDKIYGLCENKELLNKKLI